MDWSSGDSKNPVFVNVPGKDWLLSDIRARILESQGFTVATLNLDHVVKITRDPEFRAAYAKHSHVTADGNPIVWLEKLSGRKGVSLVPGSELIDPVASLAAEIGAKVGLLGSTETSLQQAANELIARNPRLQITAQLAPSMSFQPDGDEAKFLIEALRESGARVVFLALGAPKQERFASYAATSLPSVGFFSIGAGLDFISGAQKRAPLWVRAVASEWLWRLLSSPKRLTARYLACFALLPRLALRALAIRAKVSRSR